ncbi:MAG: oligosaccharide flippase family protein [Candidatus Neomarinimicrobiota bacterium]
MRSRIKALSLQTLIYGTGHILARLVTFLLLPLYTNVFDPEKYAVVSLAYMFMGFMSVVLHYGLDAALMKHYVPAGPAERKVLMSSAYVSFVSTALGFALLMYLLRRIIAEPLLGVYMPKYIAYCGLILMLDNLWSIPLLLLRSEEKPFVFIGFSLTNVGLTLGLNLMLILHFRMGVEGVLISNIIASVVVFFLTLPVVLRRVDLRQVSLPVWKKLMRFGLPFLPSGIFAMIMEMAGRYLLKFMTDMETVGIYSAGYKLGMLMLLAVMGFNMAWQPFFLREGAGDEKKVLYARIASYVVALLALLWVLLLLWVDRLVRLPIGGTTFYGPEFWSSARIVPWIALGYLFQATYLLQLPGPFLTGKSHWVATTRGAGALATILLNLVLIPRYGAMGAAAAMGLSFFIMSGFMYFINRRIFPLPFEWSRLLRVVLVTAAIYLLHITTAVSPLRDLLLVLALPAGLLLTGFLKRSELEYLRGLIGRRSRNG